MSRQLHVLSRVWPLLLLPLFFACSQVSEVIKPADQSVVSKGEQLYNANCLTCHGGSTGGDMMTIPPRHNANGHTWHHSDCQLTDIVLNGSGAMGEMMRQMMPYPENTPSMPVWKDKLSEADVAAVLAHIKTWWTPEQRRLQADITESQC